MYPSGDRTIPGLDYGMGYKTYTCINLYIELNTDIETYTHTHTQSIRNQWNLNQRFVLIVMSISTGIQMWHR